MTAWAAGPARPDSTESVSDMLRVWIAVGAAIALVLGGLVYFAGADPDDAISRHISHDFTPPFRG
jgi:hypothetical protein